MGKQGPCCHCGVTSTPLWRNGPSDKPVLCNACGSRWRTKGTLVNYTPLHLRSEPDEFEDHKTSRMRKMFMKKNESKALLHKRKLNHDDSDVVEVFGSDGGNNPGFYKSFDEGGSNRSSSGSAISNSDSCALFGGTEASDLTGPSQSTVWDTMVPSKKRTCKTRPKSSPVEKLTKELYKILKEQQASSMSGISEDDVLLETNQPMVSVEIGHGSVLIRHPSSITREEESEASSLSVDNKPHPVNEAYSRLKTLHVHNNNSVVNIPSSGIDNIKKMPSQSQCSTLQDQAKRELLEKLQMLGHHNSPLRYVGLKDVVNFDVFSNFLSSDEQLQMHKYLPSVDTCRPQESIKSMFECPQFKDTLLSFQKLLGEGVFDNSLSGVTTEDCRKLQRLLLCSLVKSKWVEQYSILKGPKSEGNTNYTPSSEGKLGNNDVATCHSLNVRTLRDGPCQKFQGAKSIPKSPKIPTMVKTNHHTTMEEPLENNNNNNNDDGSSFSPRNLFAVPPDNSSLNLSSLKSINGGDDQDLLLDIPSYSSFPQAELLYPTARVNPVYPRLLRP